MVTEIKDKLLIQEEIEPGLVTSLMRNYSNAAEAIFELIDNSVDERLPDQKLRVDIQIKKSGPMKYLVVEDSGGPGMGLDELKKFFRWGASEKLGKLGRYGQGGKAAMGYLGKGWKITSSRLGEPYQYEIYEPDWRSRKNGLRMYEPKRITEAALRSVGFARFEMNHLARPLQPKKLAEKVQETYNMLLTAGDLEVTINGDPIEPKNYPIADRYEIDLNLGKDPSGEVRKAYGWVGILKPNSGLRGGIRTCVLGRLVSSEEYFGHPDYKYKASLGQLIGEISADHLPMGLNKTNFDRDDLRWEQLTGEMHEILAPLVAKLLEEKEETVTEKEKERIKRVGKTFNEFLKNVENLSSETGEGTDRGQKKPEPPLGPKDEEPPSIEAVSRGSYEPKTPPPLGAMGERRRKPLRRGYDYDIGVSTPSVRSYVGEQEDKEIIMVNKKFPLYKERKGDELYLFETLVQEVNKSRDEEEKLDHKEYCDAVNLMLMQLHKFLAGKKSVG